MAAGAGKGNYLDLTRTHNKKLSHPSNASRGIENTRVQKILASSDDGSQSKNAQPKRTEVSAGSGENRGISASSSTTSRNISSNNRSTEKLRVDNNSYFSSGKLRESIDFVENLRKKSGPILLIKNVINDENVHHIVQIIYAESKYHIYII